MAVRVDCGLAYEALLALSVVQGTVPPERFAEGAELHRRFERLSESLRRSIRSVDAGLGLNWADLIGLVSSAPAPRGPNELRRSLGDLSAIELKLALLGYHDRSYREEIGDELFKLAASGADRAVKRFKLRAARAGRMGVVGPLITLPADLAAERTLAILEQLPEDFYVLRRTDAQVIARAAAQAAGLARMLPAAAVVEKVTHGIVYDEVVEDLLVVPTAVHRPWTLILDHESTKIFCFPVALEEAGEGEPDPEMVALYRALSDATRLRLLRRLAAGRATFGQLSRDLGLAKSTLHQHALILRTAGLVRLNLDSGLELHPDRPSLDELLNSYLSK